MFSKINYTLMRSILFNDDKFNFGSNLMKMPKMGIHRTRIRRDHQLQQQHSYYESLGVASNSTQGDIKAAYYKLSMQYHPDKNQGCEISAKKFREISQAYEVLGNYRLRKLYDKGIVYTAGAQYAHPAPPSAVDIEPDDNPETRFYKSRFKKSRVADVTGRTSIYNFDEWSRAHYGETFNRRQKTKVKYANEQQKKHETSMSFKLEIVLCGILLGMVLLSIVFSEKTFDEPKIKKIVTTEKNIKETNATTTTNTSFK